MGRASICTSTNSSQLLAALDGSNRPSDPASPPFGEQLSKNAERTNSTAYQTTNLTTDHNHSAPTLTLSFPKYTTAIKSHGSRIKFGTLTVDNIINGSEFYTEDENDRYIRPYLTEADGTHFKIDGKKFDQYKLFASFEHIKAHVIESLRQQYHIQTMARVQTHGRQNVPMVRLRFT
jgi:hypothetical protein